MATLTVEIVAPEKPLWSGTATALVAKSSEGDFTILAQHTSTVGDVVSSVVRVACDEGEIAFAVHGGYFQVGPGAREGETLASVLASVAERTSDIDVARAQLAKDAAEARLNATSRSEIDDDETRHDAEAALERAELRLRAASSK